MPKVQCLVCQRFILRMWSRTDLLGGAEKYRRDGEAVDLHLTCFEQLTEINGFLSCNRNFISDLASCLYLHVSREYTSEGNVDAVE